VGWLEGCVVGKPLGLDEGKFDGVIVGSPLG
jgi:hypothetical protein